MILGIGILMLIGLVILIFRKSGGSEEDREARFRETESLRNELRAMTKSLQDQFFQMNRAVDHKLSDSAKQLNKQLEKSSDVIGSLQKELGKMGEIGSKIENLDKILRAPKGRGSMGEESLEEILRSVFPPNLWERQYGLGQGLVVDVAVKTTSGIIPIDAKFPLPAFERLVNAENDTELERAQKDFEKDVKMRINEVAKYVRPEKGTLDFAILFLPNENIYYEAMIRSGGIAEYAKSKKVLITGPNTMLYVLQVLFQAYQSQQFAQKAQEALAHISGVRKQAERLDESISVLGKHLGNANSKLGDVQSENTKLQNQIDRVSALESGFSEESEPKEIS